MTMLKFWISVIAAVLAAILPGVDALGEGVGLAQVANVVVLAAGAIMVFVAPNIPSFRYAKTIAAVAAAVGVAFISFYGDLYLTPSEIVQLVLAGLGALGVWGVANAGTSDGVAVEGRHALPA